MNQRDLDRRTLLAALAAALVVPADVRAQAWPEGRSLKLVVPFPPGGATDVIGRLVADRLGQAWGKIIVVENKAGAGGNIGVDQVAKSEPTGDTMLVASFGMAANQFLYKKLSYDPVADLAPVTMVAMVPNLLAVSNLLPVKSVRELVDYGKANPGKLTYASSGIGTSVHLSGELFKKLTGVEMVHVPYRGSAQATQDLISGRVDLIFDNTPSILPHVRAGSVKGLGITTAKRSPSAPEFAPIADTVPGYDVSSWFGVFVPSRTPPEVVARIQANLKTALADAGTRDKLTALAAEPIGSTSAELAAFLKVEMDKWGQLIREIGIKID